MQIGIVQRPPSSARHRDAEVQFPRPTSRVPRHLHRSDRHADLEPLGCRFQQPHIHVHAVEICMRREVDAVERVAAAGFEVHGLPDALRVAVALLSFQLEWMGRVVNADGECLRAARPGELRELERERRVAALVGAERIAIEPGGSAPIRGPDHQEDALALPVLRDHDALRIPADARGVADAGEWRRPREGNQDLAAARQLAIAPARLRALVRRVKRESPRAVEIQPLGAGKVGTGLFGQRNGVGCLGVQGAGKEREGSGQHGGVRSR